MPVEATPKPYPSKLLKKDSDDFDRKFVLPIIPATERKIDPRFMQKYSKDQIKSDYMLFQNRNDFKLPPQLKSRIEPISAESIKSSSSKKTNSIKSDELSPKRTPNSILSSNPQTATEKLSTISIKLESLQGKLNIFESTYNNLKALKEEDDSESVISTVSVINKRRQDAAILIQKHYRRYIQKKKFRDFTQQFRKEPYIEPIAVKTKERTNQTENNQKKKIGVITLVSSYLCKPIRKKKSLLKSIILIQANFRKFLAKKHYKKKIKALLIIQRAVKAFHIKKIYQKIISAVIFIQAVYRGYKARKFVKAILPKGVLARLRSQKLW